MRILFVLPELPYAPLTGSHTRPLAMLDAAAQQHEVVAVGAAPPGADLAVLGERCACLLPVDSGAARPAGRRVLATGRRALSPVPLLGRGRSEAVAGQVAHALADLRPDALFLETMYAVHYRATGLPTIVDLPDVVSGLCEAAAAARPLRYAATRLQASASRRAEPLLLAGTVPVTINDEDRRRLARLGVSSFCVPLGVTAPPDEALPGEPLDDPAGPPGAPLRLLFVGSFAHAPNREAARFIIRRLVPALRATAVPFRLTIAGHCVPAWLRNAAGADVVVASDVPDLTPIYEATDVVLAPLAHGGGTKNKTLEAMAWALPVVGTDQAFTGLTAGAREPFVRTPLRATDMAIALAALGADRELRRALGAAARRYVIAAHAPGFVAARAAVLFDAVIAGGGVSEAEALWAEHYDCA